MVKVIGVRFRTAGKIYFFDPGKLKISRNDHVIVETARGIEYGIKDYIYCNWKFPKPFIACKHSMFLQNIF